MSSDILQTIQWKNRVVASLKVTTVMLTSFEDKWSRRKFKCLLQLVLSQNSNNGKCTAEKHTVGG